MILFSGIESQLAKTDESTFKAAKSKILINDRYLMKKILQRGENFNIYEGVDVIDQKYVSIYIKPFSTQNYFSKQIKQQFRNKIAPLTLWVGSHKIQKFTYYIQIQAKYGPSLKTMFASLQKPITQNDFIHLFYQMMKLVQKIGSCGFVHRELSTNSIIFDPNPQKNQLYILNTFTLKKKNQESSKKTGKYASKGSHLGLSANIKDDLESICYILLDIYSQGKFLKNHKPQQYEVAKSSLDPKSICPQLPQIFLDLYYYVMTMNYTDEINYFHWKNLILKTISKQIVTKPFSWMMSTQQKKNKPSQQIDYHPDDSNLANQIYQEDKENLHPKLDRFKIQCKANSMKEKLHDINLERIKQNIDKIQQVQHNNYEQPEPNFQIDG